MGSVYPSLMQPQESKGFPVWAIILIAAGGGIVVIIGIVASLAIYSTRKYLASAKSAEAKNSVGAIARMAATTYERDRTLCGSALPVPATATAVRGIKYMPSSSSGRDYDTGNATEGWKCLKFAMTMPHYYQYHYHQGSGYLARPVAPGPKGFEAAAKGDLNGDEVLSTFARTGQIGPSGDLVLSTTVYVENEFE